MRTTVLRSVALVGLLIGALALGAAASAAAPPPATLTGEQFTGTTTNAAACVGNANIWTATYTGTATGPYPGTFTETVTFDPSRASLMTTAFTITSAAGSVSGTTAATTADAIAPCNGATSFGGGFFGTYAATIIPPTAGKYRDAGGGSLSAFAAADGNGTLQSHTFTSTQATTAPIVPTSAQECKDHGWQSYGGQFKNEGSCLAFLTTGGSHPRGKP